MSGIDMRWELVEHLRAHGHWAVLRSQVLGSKCRCAVEDNGVADSHCRRCMGTGFLFVDHIVKLDKRLYSPDQMLDAGIGEAPSGTTRYYLERKVPAKRNDMILEVELDADTLLPVQPFRIQEAHRITQVDDLRDRGGRLEFLQVHVETVGAR